MLTINTNKGIKEQITTDKPKILKLTGILRKGYLRNLHYSQTILDLTDVLLDDTATLENGYYIANCTFKEIIFPKGEYKKRIVFNVKVRTSVRFQKGAKTGKDIDCLFVRLEAKELDLTNLNTKETKIVTSFMVRNKLGELKVNSPYFLEKTESIKELIVKSRIQKANIKVALYQKANILELNNIIDNTQLKGKIEVENKGKYFVRLGFIESQIDNLKIKGTESIVELLSMSNTKIKIENANKIRTNQETKNIVLDITNSNLTKDNLESLQKTLDDSNTILLKKEQQITNEQT